MCIYIHIYIYVYIYMYVYKCIHQYINIWTALYRARAMAFHLYCHSEATGSACALLLPIYV